MIRFHRNDVRWRKNGTEVTSYSGYKDTYLVQVKGESKLGHFPHGILVWHFSMVFTGSASECTYPSINYLE